MLPLRQRPVLGLALAAGTLASLATLVPTAGASISGVCPDGSFFVVQRAEDVPCREAKRVAPGDLPPLKPHLLPRPYRWEVHNRKHDPNNPYNLVEGEAPDAAGGDAGTGVGSEARAAERTPPAPLPPVAAPPRPEPPVAARRAPGLALSETELGDLADIVELSQQRAPAALRDGRGWLLRLAHSRSFEPLVRDALGGKGPVLLFSAEAASAGAFHPNLTFVQGHVAFHPRTGDPRQLGLLRGAAGELGEGDSVLGYVVLPEHVDLAQPLDVYWDDRRLTATLRP